MRRARNGFTWSDLLNKVGSTEKAEIVQNRPSSVGNTSSKINNTSTIDDLAGRVIMGEFGNGDVRKQKLGNRYEEVQKRVNQLLGNSRTNNNVKTINYDSLVQRTIRGDFGNGETRKRKLGKHYGEVQKRVNRILR